MTLTNGTAVVLSPRAAEAIQRLRYCDAHFGLDRVLAVVTVLRESCCSEDDPVYRSLVELLQEVERMDNGLVDDPDYDGPREVDYGGGAATDPNVRAAQDKDRV